MIFIVGFRYDLAITLTFYGYKDIILYFWKEILNQNYSHVNSNNGKFSYRNNRDYKKQCNWTCKLNKDLFDCCTKTREDPNKGYMKRMRDIWDTLHTELNHFNEKYLRQRATYIQQRHFILETQTVANSNKENQNVDNTHVREDEVEDTTNDIDEQLNTPLQVQNCLQNIQITNKKLYETRGNSFTIN